MKKSDIQKKIKGLDNLLYFEGNKPLHILGPLIFEFKNSSPFSQFKTQGKIIVFLFIIFIIILINIPIFAHNLSPLVKK